MAMRQQRKKAKRSIAYPNIEVKVLIRDRLDVETDSRNGCNNLANLSKSKTLC